MSVIQINVHPAAQQRLEALEAYCQKNNLQQPRMTIDLEAGAVAEQIAYVKQLLVQIAVDKDIADTSKEELSNFLAQISLQLKRIMQGSSMRQTALTSSRLAAGKAMGELHGEKSTIVPKPGELKAGTVHFSDDGLIELVIDGAFKI